MERIKFTKRPRLKKPFMICAWPGMGDVAFKAALHLIDTLKAEEFASIRPEEFFYLTGSVVQEGVISLPELPYNTFYYWKDKGGAHDLIIFVSNAQPDLIRAEEYSRLLNLVARKYHVERMIGFAAMPQPIDHTQMPGVWFTATSQSLKEELRGFNLNVLNEGQVSGMNGLFLAVAKSEGIEGFCLLGEIPLYTIQIENPKASYAVLEAFCRITGLTVELTPLLEHAQSMEGEINKLLEYLKVSPPAGPIGDDEIERIKKTLGQLTKLPVSVKERIDKLFDDARHDLSKANELKRELDKWNVYKEYEDQFLDLFKKHKDGNN
jgi:uncharacterized protein